LDEDGAMLRTFIVVAVLTLAAAPVAAQQPFAYPSPEASQYSLMPNVTFGSVDGTSLRMDVFRPTGAASSGAPALIFSFQAVGDQRMGFGDGFYKWWAQLAASRGVVGILPDLRQATATQDVEALLAHLAQHAANYGIDPQRIAIYGASANAWRVFPFVEDPKQTTIKAAVIYYGAADVKEFRRDLPVLYVRAGLDRPALNRDITALASLAVAQNAPLTLLNHPAGYHGFEIANHDDATREVIDRTLEFVKRATAPGYQAAIRAGLPESTAAAHVVTNNHAAAAAAYAPLVAARPDDARLRLSYGEALLGDRQYAAACDEFEKLRKAPLGPRDRGIPAAKACLGKGDPAAAVEWLSTIPARFLPPQTREDPAFAALKDRPDFKALFERK
jgi:dienelactone hydrolase